MGDTRTLTPQQMEEYERDGAALLSAPTLSATPPRSPRPHTGCSRASTDTKRSRLSLTGAAGPGAGFLLLQNWLDAAEVEQMLAIAKADHAFTDAGTDLTDADGNISRLSLRMWELPEDTYSAFVRHPAIVGPLQQLHGPMYHFHHKMMLKEPRTGGAWEWHQVRRTLPPLPRRLGARFDLKASQDFGYWYQQGYMRSDLASCMIACDRASKENGCLKARTLPPSLCRCASRVQVVQRAA